MTYNLWVTKSFLSKSKLQVLAAGFSKIFKSLSISRNSKINPLPKVMVILTILTLAQSAQKCQPKLTPVLIIWSIRLRRKRVPKSIWVVFMIFVARFWRAHCPRAIKQVKFVVQFFLFYSIDLCFPLEFRQEIETFK